MQRKICLFLMLFIGSSVFVSAQNASVSGVVSDSDSGDIIQGANLILKGTDYGTVSDSQGHYSILQIPNGKYNMVVAFVGYENLEHEIDVKEGMMPIQLSISRKITMFDDVEISTHVDRDAESLLKLPVKLEDIPLTTSSITAELLDETQAVSINEALKYATGIKPMLNYGGFQTFVMRGYGAPVIMLDGVRDERMNFSNSAPLTSLAAVERIEYLKGPASVLYGHSAVGGILNIVRKQPSNDFNANFSGSYGSWKTKRSLIGIGNRINDKLSYRFDAGFSDTKGWRDAADNTLNGYFALNYELNENNLFEFRLAANDDTYGTETGLPAVTNDIYSLNGDLKYENGELPGTFKFTQRYNDPSDFLNHENVNTSLKYTGKLGEKSKLQVHVSYSDDLIDYFSTEELSYLTSYEAIYDTYYMSGDNKVYVSLDTLQRTFPLRFSHETKTFQNNIDFNTEQETGNVKHKINIGYFFMYINRTSFKGYDLGEDVSGEGLYAKIAVVDPVLNQGDLQTSFSKASIYCEHVNGLYAQNLIEVSEKLNVMAAVRYDNYHMEYQSATIADGRNFDEKSDPSTIVNHAITFRLGAVYKPVSNLSLYASYASFFKPKRSVYNENYIYINKDGERFFPEDGEEVYEPESGYQVEIGFKYDHENILQLNGSAYYIKKNNIVEYLDVSDDGNRIYGQVGVVDSKGFDMEAIYKPCSAISILAGYGFNIAKYQEFSANDYTSSKEGNYISNNPKNHVFLWAYYKYKKFNAGLGMDYNDKLFTNSSNTYQLPSYCTVDAVFAYNFKPAFLKLKVNNIFDVEYFSSSVYSSQYIPGQGRNVMLTLGVNL
jgi:iron complex outermembrane receptor protein